MVINFKFGFKFHSNLDYKLNQNISCQNFIKIYFSIEPYALLLSRSSDAFRTNFIVNKYIQINNKTGYFKMFPENNINFGMDFFDEQGKLKWSVFKVEYHLKNRFHCQQLQLKDAISKI